MSLSAYCTDCGYFVDIDRIEGDQSPCCSEPLGLEYEADTPETEYEIRASWEFWEEGADQNKTP